MKVIEDWYFVGNVERPAMTRRPSYRWCPGYSRRADGGEQPWQTRQQVLAGAKDRGTRARFNGRKV